MAGADQTQTSDLRAILISCLGGEELYRLHIESISIRQSPHQRERLCILLSGHNVRAVNDPGINDTLSETERTGWKRGQLTRSEMKIIATRDGGSVFNLTGNAGFHSSNDMCVKLWVSKAHT